MADEPVPVESCVGWLNQCPFCDKRFSTWIPIEEEDAISSVPGKPGIFMFAFDNKRGKEIVDVGIHKVNIQISITPQLRDLRRQISEKKLKETKSSILLRYVIVEDVASKEACCIYAHWQNYGVLPRLATKWPGLRILKDTGHFGYLEGNEKWCYPVKDPVWRKQKTNTAPKAIPKCKGWTESCNYCDGKFTTWVPIEGIASKGKVDTKVVPEGTGFYMYAVNDQGKREIIKISASANIREDIKYAKYYSHYANLKYHMKNLKPDFAIEVRWMTVNDLKDNDSCFMYAHFLNHGEVPVLNHELPGAEILGLSEYFVFSQRNKQWCHDGGQDTRPKTVSKTKERREMLRSMLEDLHT